MASITQIPVIEAVIDEATTAGIKAASIKLKELQEAGPAFEVIDKINNKIVGAILDVSGIAWIHLSKANTKFAQYLKRIDIGRNSYRGGMNVYLDFNLKSQLMAVNEAAACAATQVFKKHGIDCCMQSNMI